MWRRSNGIAKPPSRITEWPNAHLGDCYYSGQGVAKDETEAVKWYRKAAEQNLALAQCNLGFCYLNGHGVSKDKSEAVEWYRKAAEQNHANAQFNLGNSYYNGQGVAKDEVEAVKWYRKAAEQNYALAECAMGNCYYNGQGVAKDETEAAMWYRSAAKSGEVSAFNPLARILATSGSSEIRDASNAVVFAKRAVVVTERKSPAELDTLAAAYAEAGQFDEAVSTEREAIALLQAETEKEEYRTRLELFEVHLPLSGQGVDNYSEPLLRLEPIDAALQRREGFAVRRCPRRVAEVDGDRDAVGEARSLDSVVGRQPLV